MKNKIFLVIQMISGLMLVIFGLNGFLQFMSMPLPAPEMGQYLGALFASGFVFPIVSFVLLVTGISFLINKFTSLFAIILAPIILNAFLSHIFLDMNGIGASMFLLLITISVMIANRERYAEIFKA